MHIVRAAYAIQSWKEAQKNSPHSGHHAPTFTNCSSWGCCPLSALDLSSFLGTRGSSSGVRKQPRRQVTAISSLAPHQRWQSTQPPGNLLGTQGGSWEGHPGAQAQVPPGAAISTQKLTSAVLSLPSHCWPIGVCALHTHTPQGGKLT